MAITQHFFLLEQRPVPSLEPSTSNIPLTLSALRTHIIQHEKVDYIQR